MLENEGASLGGMTLETGIIFTHRIGSATFDCRTAVWIMAINTIDLSFHDRMVIRQLKFRANFQVALETGFGRLVRIDNGSSRSP